MGEKTSKRVRRVEGQIVRIDLKNGTHAYGAVLPEPLLAFYDRLYFGEESPSLDEIALLPIAFKVWVMNYAITKGIWPVVGNIVLQDNLKDIPAFYKQDIVSGGLSIYQSVPERAPSYERPATYEECLGLEAAMVWSPEHVEDRLRDHFAGRLSKWSVRARTPDEFRAWQEEMRKMRAVNRLSN